MVYYKLNYFDIRGLAEVSRCILHYAGVTFEDNRFTHEEWPAIKPSAPFGQAPFLEVDGVVIAQSQAIARYLAKEYNLAGKNNLESALLDSYGDLIKDFLNKIRPFFLILLGRVEGDKEKAANELKQEINETFPFFEKAISAAGSGFIAKSGVSWVDFFLATILLTLENLVPGSLKNFVHLNKTVKNVNELPQLKSYFTNRKDTKV